MLTDIFLDRYPDEPKWTSVAPTDVRFIGQSLNILKDQLFPPKAGTAWIGWNVDVWTSVHDKLSNELGVENLVYVTERFPSQWPGGRNAYDVSETFFRARFDPSHDEPDNFVKLRFSSRGSQRNCSSSRTPNRRWTPLHVS